MERNVLVEENRRSGDPKIVSKSMEASVKIDSISVDLINAAERSEVVKCEHFSIRGYVSDFRKKDWKKCWPFASDDDDNKYEGQTCMLPPLHVPRFRFWHCQKCLPEIGVEGSADQCGSVHKSCCSGLKSNRICLHAPKLGDAATQLSDFQQASELFVLEGRKVDADAASNFNNTVDPSSCVNEKEREIHGGKGHIIGKTVGTGDNLNQEIEGMTCVGTAFLSLMQKNPTDDIAVSSKCDGSINLCKPVCGHQKVTDVELAKNLNCMVGSTSTVCEVGKENFMDNQQKDVLSCGKSGESGDAKEGPNADKGHATEYTSQELDESGRASSESADILGGNNLHCDNSSGPRRKTRKVRLLIELLNENRDGDIHSIRTEDSLSNATTDIYTGADKLLAPQYQEGAQGNVRRSLVQNRKKELPQDEDWRPPETSSPSKPCKEVRMLKGAESTYAVTGPESEEDASGRLGLQSGMKNWTKGRIDRSPIVGRKKLKKTLTSDDCLSSAQRKENVPDDTGDKMENASKDIAAEVVSLQLDHNPLTVREINLFPSPSQGIERNSFCKMESKMPRFDDQQASVTSWNHGKLREVPMMGDGIQIIHSGSASIPLHPEQDAFSENGLELSLNSYFATQRHDGKHIPHVEDRRTSLFNWRVVTPEEDQVARKAAETKYVENFSVSSKSASDATYGKGLCSELSGKRPTYRMPFLNEKQICTSQVEIGNCSLMQPKDFCSTSSNEKTNGLREHLAFTRKADDQRASKVSELGALDDIPMEIVELMAKIQYERCLPDAEHDTRQFDRTNNTRNAQTMDHGIMNGHRELPFLQQAICRRQKSQAKTRRNGISKADENVGPTKQMSVDYFSQAGQNQVNMNQLEQAYVPAGFEAFLRRQEKLPSGIQYSASSSSLPSEWVGNIDGKRPFYTSLQALGPCSTCQNIPQQSKDANHPWPSMMPSQMPFVYSIPQKCAAPSTNMKLLSHSSGSNNRENTNGNHNLKFLNQNAAGLEKQSGMFGTETLSRAHAELPFACKHNVIELNQKQKGSLDLYSNDTIPAMHLLSLMDAGLRSSATVNMDATPKFFKGLPATHSRDHNQFSRLDSGAYKASNTVKHPLYDFHGKNQLAEGSQGPIPAIPITNGSASSFRDDRRFKKATDFTSPVSQEKGKRKISDSRVQNRGCASQKSVSASIYFDTNCGSPSVHSMQTMFFGDRDSTMLPMHLQALKNSTNHGLEAPSAAGAVHCHKSTLETQLCSVNRNPADFSIPEAENEYMIAGENLKVARAVPFANGSGLVKLEGHKRQRKVSAAKEHGHRVTS